MIDLESCLTDDSEIILTKSGKARRSFFNKNRRPDIIIKDFNHAEFIGEELCAIKHIRCCHYFLVGICSFKIVEGAYYGSIKDSNYLYKIGSYDFRQKDKEYKRITEYQFDERYDSITNMMMQVEDEENKKKLRLELINLLALDTYMGQIDRTYKNLLFEEDEHKHISLAPLFDFEYSLKRTYLRSDNIYEGDLYTFHNLEDYYKFIDMYPEFRDILASYLKIDLIKVIDNAYSRRGLIIPKDKWKYYEEFEESRKELIKKIVK